jgi:GTP cyclohydrolase I
MDDYQPADTLIADTDGLSEKQFPADLPRHPLAEHFKALIKYTGENPDREGLVRTPERAAKAFQFLTRGYQEDIAHLVNGAVFQSTNRDMVVVRDIEFYSLCEHHILPFFGKVHVAYLPRDKVIGLSKIPRIVDVFSRRLQIQENLNEQIAKCIQQVTQAEGVIVTIEARHMCMLMRGVEKQNASMTTSTRLGRFKENESLVSQFTQLVLAPRYRD